MTSAVGASQPAADAAAPPSGKEGAAPPSHEAVTVKGIPESYDRDDLIRCLSGHVRSEQEPPVKWPKHLFYRRDISVGGAGGFAVLRFPTTERAGQFCSSVDRANSRAALGEVKLRVSRSEKHVTELPAPSLPVRASAAAANKEPALRSTFGEVGLRPFVFSKDEAGAWSRWSFDGKLFYARRGNFSADRDEEIARQMELAKTGLETRERAAASHHSAPAAGVGSSTQAANEFTKYDEAQWAETTFARPEALGFAGSDTGVGHPQAVLHVAGFSDVADEEQIWRIFEQYGCLEGLYFPRDPISRVPQKWCFVSFNSVEAAQAACGQADGLEMQDGTVLQVKFREANPNK